MNTTNSTHRDARATSPVRVTRALALAIASGACLPVGAQALFANPELAANALIDAIATNDPQATARVLGKSWRQLLPLDRIDKELVYDFLAKASQSRTVKIEGVRGDLVVGTDPWTLPIPLRQAANGQWQFDPVAARLVIAERRIGANERAAMRSALAYVDAQREYALADRSGDGLLEYARKLVSSPGKRDGLIWSPTLGDDSPLGEAYLPSKPGQGYHGYRYRILTGQGASAPGGAHSYLIGKRMTAGFALLAWPVQYGVTGVTSFVVSSAGVLYERDLGAQTSRVAARIKLFDPDETWAKTSP